MKLKDKVSILTNMFKDGHGVLPVKLSHKDVCELIDLEREGFGHRRGPQETSGGRPIALDILHRRLCKIRREEEYIAILSEDEQWHKNYTPTPKQE